MAPQPQHPMQTPLLSRRHLLRAAGAAAVAGVAAPLVAGCAGAPKQGAGGKTFTVYWNAGHAYQAYEKVISEFEKAHGVTVNLQKYQWPDMRTRVLADFASGNVPDVIEEGGGWVKEFAVTGDALSLQKYVDQDGEKMGFPDDWQPSTIDRNSHNGDVYGIQMHLTCNLLLFNRQMLDKAGVKPPTTWDDMVDAAKELTRGGVHGIALNQDHQYSGPWMLQNGVREFDPETKQVLTPRDAAVEALQFQSDLIHKHKVSPVPPPGTDYSGPQKLLSANRAAMILTGPWDLAPIDKSSPDLDLGIAPALSHKKQATIAAGTSLFVPAKAKQPDLSWDFIKRITALKTETAVTKEAGMLMPRVSWTKDPVVAENERTKAFADGLEYAVDRYADLAATGQLGKVQELYKTLYQGVVIKGQPVEKAVSEYAAAVEKMLAD